MEIEIKVNKRSKRILLRVMPNGTVRVTIPSKKHEEHAIEFVQKNHAWVAKRKAVISQQQQIPEISKYQKERVKRQLRKMLTPLIDRACEIYKVKYKKLTFRHTVSRWGSCSMNNTLSFNLKLFFLPQHLKEYIVVHEVCHLVEHNHSATFWKEVAKTVPDYKNKRKELKNYV